MKIAWFTPFTIKSAIGRVDNANCEQLSKTCDVDIWTCSDGELIATSLNIIKYNPDEADILNLSAYDHVIYSMGNFAGYHQPIWQVMQKYPGIVVLHDQTMHGLFQQSYIIREYGGDPVNGYSGYIDFIERYHGAQGIDAANAVWKESEERISNTELVTRFHLLQPILDKARGVFTHASFFAEKLRDYFHGPIGFAYLPCPPPMVDDDCALPEEITADDGKLIIVSTGIVHPVKRIDKVANVLLKHKDISDRVHYVVIGEYGGPFGENLKELANGPLMGCLHLLGYLPDSMMKACLDRADLCINLRYPNSEVCSYSLLEQMAFGKPVIVINSGFYSEMPDDSVMKISIDHEESDLEGALRKLIDDSALRGVTGSKARAFVHSNCTAENYANRLAEFLNEFSYVEQSVQVNRKSLSTVNGVLRNLGFCRKNVPWAIDTVTSVMGDILMAQDRHEARTDYHVLGVWFGFNYTISLKREGITRFLLFMVQSLMRNYPIRCEIWTYSFNEKDVSTGFKDIIDDPVLAERIIVVTEKNWKETLHVPHVDAALVWDVNEKRDNLCDIARLYSKAECFVPAIIYLDNVIGTDKPIFVPAHDMAVHQFYSEFIGRDPLYKFRMQDITSRAEHLARSGAIMFGISDSVRYGQLLKFVRNLRESSSDMVYLPVLIPKDIDQRILKEEEIRSRFNLNHPYLFYATQIRPYKNVSVLIRAFASLCNSISKLDLVLTGNPSDVPEVEELIRDFSIKNRVICVKNVSETELYSLYRYAECIPIPTRFEGGFPLQAGEALYMNTPIVLSQIPIVEERIKSLGFNLGTCGLALFDPYDPEELANHIDEALRDKQGFVERQNDFRERLLKYSWDDAARHYFSIFFGSE